MAKFHIKKDGTPGVCNAKQGNCPYGDAQHHFSSEEKAQEYADKINLEKLEAASQKPAQFNKSIFMQDFSVTAQNLQQFTDEVLQNKVSHESYNKCATLLNNLEDAREKHQWSDMVELAAELEDFSEANIKESLGSDYDWYDNQIDKLYGELFETLENEVQKDFHVGF